MLNAIKDVKMKIENASIMANMSLIFRKDK